MSKLLDEMKAKYGSRKKAARRPPSARKEKSFDIEADTGIRATGDEPTFRPRLFFE